MIEVINMPLISSVYFKGSLTFIDSEHHKFDSNWQVEKRLLIANGVNSALINEWRNVSQQ